MYPNPETIIRAVAAVFYVTPEEITGKRRRRNEADARHACAYLMHRLLRASNEQIASSLKRSDPSSGAYMHIHGRNKYDHDKQYRAMVDRVSSLIATGTA